jgi:ribosome biogenesis GTPase A
MFIINKFDVLPSETNEERVKIWVGERLKELLNGLNLVYSYVMLSSKNGFNFDYIIYKLKKVKEQGKSDRIPKPKVYIVGNANVGKSSFINKLIARTNRFDQPDPYVKNYDIDVNVLTTSPLPGTTIGITKVEPIRLGLKVLYLLI